MLLVLSLALAYGGFAAVCLSMQRHQRDVLGRALSARQSDGLRVMGYALLCLTYWPCAMRTASSVGILLWMGVLSAAAILFVAILAWRGRPVLWTAPVGLITALLLQGLNG